MTPEYVVYAVAFKEERLGKHPEVDGMFNERVIRLTAHRHPTLVLEVSKELYDALTVGDRLNITMVNDG